MNNIKFFRAQFKLMFWATYFLGAIFVFSQTVYEPITKDVYPFLQRMSQKGIVEINDLILPLSRQVIAEKLIELKWRRGEEKKGFTAVDKEELEFWVADFQFEINQIKRDTDKIKSHTYWLKDKYNRYRLFSYDSELFTVNLDPIFGIKYGGQDGESYKHWWSGFATYGYLGPFGFSFDMRDNHESGNNIDVAKIFSPETGTTVGLKKGNSVDYSEFKSSLGVNWSWGEISINKGFIEWGYGYRGKLTMSSNAPSFPYIRLDLHPTDWLSFNYFHAWLASDVIDSTSSYATFRENVDRTVWRNKYLASHTITFTFSPNLKFSLGESIVYSDQLEFLYIFPLSFFRAADHYLSGSDNNAGANSQFFFNVSSKNLIPKTHLWAELFIDEIAVADIGNPKRERNQIAFAFGGSNVDFIIPNMDIKLSYTKIYPFVYKNFIPTQTYKSRGFVIGHWMGHNADQVYMEIGYRIIRGLQTKIWTEVIRKGGDGNVEEQYSRPQPPFLFGERKNYTNWGFEVKYEIVHDLTTKLVYNSYMKSEEQLDGSFLDTKRPEFYFAVYYGL